MVRLARAAACWQVLSRELADSLVLLPHDHSMSPSGVCTTSWLASPPLLPGGDLVGGRRFLGDLPAGGCHDEGALDRGLCWR